MITSITKQNFELIAQIARRASVLADNHGVEYPVSHVVMDLDKCMTGGCDLRLEELSKADDGNFAHDVFGIRTHLDRKSGNLSGGFWPRYSV